MTSCNITNLRDLCAHPVLISFWSPSLLIFWISCFSIFRSQSLEFTTCQHPRISVTSYFQTSSKDCLLSVSLPHFSCPPCLEYLCPRALILLRLWRYINHVTYKNDKANNKAIRSSHSLTDYTIKEQCGLSVVECLRITI